MGRPPSGDQERASSTATLTIVLLLASTGPAAAQLVSSGRTLTATTANTVATFAGPDLVGLVNSVTGETCLTNPSTGELAAVNAVAGGGPLTASDWVVGQEPGTGDPIASITAASGGRSLSLEVKIDSARQEVVLRMRASVAAPGLRDASWSIAGLDFSAGRLIVPANSGIAFDRSSAGIGSFLQYPNFWHAQMLVYEAPRGSVVLYSTDTAMSFKQLRITTRGQTTVDVAIATEAAAPFPSATVVATVEWRLKAFAGDWRTAAETFRQWLAVNRPPLPDMHPWASNIRAVVQTGPNTALLPLVAGQFTPANTLLFVTNWRQDAFDENYPDYTPRAGVDAFIASAHALGFRVMLHVDLYGVSDYNPDYETVRAFQLRQPETLELMGWEWNKSPPPPYRFAFINPAAAAFRSLLISRLSAHINTLAPDALHLDIAAFMHNDGNGLIDGMNFAQGSNRLHEELTAAFPAIALDGEGENDIIYRYHRFAQAWNVTAEAPGHPIAIFLFAPQVRYYGRVSQPPPRDPGFRHELIELERRAMLPIYQVFRASDVDTTDPDVSRLLGVERAWQTHAFTPSWQAPWPAGTIRYQGLAGVTAEFVESPSLTSLSAAGTTLFQVAHGVNRLTTASFVPSWPAFDDSTLYGLNPALTYYVDPLPRPTATHVTSLPAGVQLGAGTIVGSSFAHVEPEITARDPYDFTTHLLDARPGVRYHGADYPIANGALAVRRTITVGGITRTGLFLHPPYLGQQGGETFVEYVVAVPAAAFLRFAVGAQDTATCTDGVSFHVTIDGVERWSRHLLRSEWVESALDLSAESGRSVALRLISHPGPAANPNCDWSIWSGVTLDTISTVPPFDVPISLAAGSPVTAFDGDGSLTIHSPAAATVEHVPAPGSFTLFTVNRTPVSVGANLAALPFEVWQAGAGELARPGAASGAGTVGPGTSGGVTKSSSIAAPPPSGRTILAWVTRLPASPVRLSWSAGLTDGRFSFDGVDFLVRVNGATYWRTTRLGTGWVSSAVELSRWTNQYVLIELITDQRGNYWEDFPLWADLTLMASSTTCTYSIAGAGAIGRDGGQVSAALSTPSGCPWTASSSAPWLMLGSGSGSGVGNATVVANAAPNHGPLRTAVLTIGGQPFTVTQDGSLAAPVTVDDSYSTIRATPLIIAAPGLLQNDSANGSGPLSAALVAGPAHGTLTLEAGGGFIYTPDAGFVGGDPFTYRAVNAGGSGNVATVLLTVNETTVPQPPTGLYVSAQSGNQLTFRFTPPAFGPAPTGYVLEGGVASGQVLAGIPVGTEPIVTVSAPDGVFFVRVHTLAGQARSAASNEARIFINAPAVPSPPANLVGLVTGSQLGLAWRNTFEGGPPTSLLLDVTGSISASVPLGLSETFTFNGVPAGTYRMSLRAVNASGAGAASNAVTLTFPGPCSGPPSPPSAFLAYRVANTIFVVWEPPTSGPAPAGYVLNVTGSLVDGIPTTLRSLAGSVGPGTYNLSVAATNACGTSGATTTWSVFVP